MASGVVEGSVQTDMNQYFATEQEGPATVSISSPNYDNTYYLFIWTTQPDDCGSYSVSLSAEISGCTDPTASNYNPDATVNANCLYVGVTQPNDSCDNAIAAACGEVVMGNTGVQRVLVEPMLVVDLVQVSGTRWITAAWSS